MQHGRDVVLAVSACPNDSIFIEDVDGIRIFHTWYTTVTWQPRHSCGIPNAPKAIAILFGLVETGERL